MPNDKGPLGLIGDLIRLSRPAIKLQGRKTYFNSAIMIAIGVYMLLTGEAPTYAAPAGGDPSGAMMMILNGLGLGTLRAGIAKNGSK